MLKNEIAVGEVYMAKVSNDVVDVRVDRIEKREGYSIGTLKRQGGTRYHCTNLKTGRSIIVKSAAKFRRQVT